MFVRLQRADFQYSYGIRLFCEPLNSRCSTPIVFVHGEQLTKWPCSVRAFASHDSTLDLASAGRECARYRARHHETTARSASRLCHRFARHDPARMLSSHRCNRPLLKCVRLLQARPWCKTSGELCRDHSSKFTSMTAASVGHATLSSHGRATCANRSNRHRSWQRIVWPAVRAIDAMSSNEQVHRDWHPRPPLANRATKRTIAGQSTIERKHSNSSARSLHHVHNRRDTSSAVSRSVKPCYKPSNGVAGTPFKLWTSAVAQNCHTLCERSRHLYWSIKTASIIAAPAVKDIDAVSSTKGYDVHIVDIGHRSDMPHPLHTTAPPVSTSRSNRHRSSQRIVPPAVRSIDAVSSKTIPAVST